MTPIEQVRKDSEAFAEQHLEDLCQEILDWSETGVLCDDLLRQLADMWRPYEDHHSITIAESFVKAAAFRRIAQGGGGR